MQPQSLFIEDEVDQELEKNGQDISSEIQHQVNVFIVDTETNGLGGPIVEIFIRNICNEKSFGSLVKPFDGCKMTQDAIKIKGITDEMLQEEGEDFRYVVEDLVDYVRDCEGFEDDVTNIFIAQYGQV
eukprot:Pompholyxophrys_punicea_v1_NODE_140_length_3249_cov_4.736068.p4 type:complete len:128 gc:universal NODE_140_length_3249_cov_4.736068:777-394(-)